MNKRFDKKLFDQIEEEEIKGLKEYLKKGFRINFRVQEELKK